MGMSSTPQPPPAPDPMATAQAQAQMNKDTAISQAWLNNYDQITPDGSLTYEQIGTAPDGTPRFRATTKLSDASQGIYDTNKITEQNIANIGRDQSARIGDLLGSPLKLGNEATEARLMELGMKRLDPQFARDEEAMRTRLINSGIREGSAAWNAEMGRASQSRNDAINQLILSGRGLANQEILTERNAPINEITALLNGSQVSQPNFVGTPQTSVAGVDYAGLVRDKYNADMSAYNSANASNAAMMGGLFGLAGSLGSMGLYKYSDPKMKKDVKKVGKLDNGLNVYEYKYKGSDTPEIGLMADEVEKKKPHAVVVDAMKRRMVNYAEAVQ